MCWKICIHVNNFVPGEYQSFWEYLNFTLISRHCLSALHLLHILNQSLNLCWYLGSLLMIFLRPRVTWNILSKKIALGDELKLCLNARISRFNAVFWTSVFLTLVFSLLLRANLSNLIPLLMYLYPVNQKLFLTIVHLFKIFENVVFNSIRPASIIFLWINNMIPDQVALN